MPRKEKRMEFIKNGLRIRLERVGVIQTNCYVVTRKDDSKYGFIVDPGGEEEKIVRVLNEMGCIPVGILLTHGHFDHILAVEHIRRRYGVKVYVHEKEAELIENDQENGSGLMGFHYACIPDVLLKDGDEIELAGIRIKVIHTPGHTAGGACYFLENEGVLFSGDTLFRESVGRTDWPTGNVPEAKLLALKLFIRL